MLAYRKLNLDVKARMLRPEQEITVCTEFTLDGVVQSVRQFWMQKITNFWRTLRKIRKI